MDRYYDLNGREKCVTAIITISDKTFRISRVVIAVRTLYSNHISEMGKLLERLAAYDKEKDPDGKEEKRITEEAEAFSKEKMALYERCIRLLLEKNGYTYDAAWWDENTDEVDRRSFIEKCLMKDRNTAAGEKKKENPGK